MPNNKECSNCHARILDGLLFCPHCGHKQPQPLSEDDVQRDPFRILQISPDAELEVIEAAYRSLARKYHPDVSSTSSSNARMKDINWAHDILTDPEKRREWERKRKVRSPSSNEDNQIRRSTYPDKQQQHQTTTTTSPVQPQRSSVASSYPSPSQSSKAQRPRSASSPWPILITLGVIGLCLAIFINAIVSSPTTNSNQVIPSKLSPTRLPTPTSRRRPTETVSSPLSDCMLWSKVTMDDVGRKLCVYGEIVSAYSNDNVFYILFNQKPGHFYLLSYDVIYPDVVPGACVSVMGEIEHIGDSPVIVLRPSDELGRCS